MTPNEIQHPVDLSAQQRSIADQMNQRIRTEWEEKEREKRMLVAEQMQQKPVVGTAIQGATDPWKHRSSGMHCDTCMWFIKKDGAVHGLGRCRRHAPTMNGYPAVFVDDWCGDHKLDENKVEK